MKGAASWSRPSFARRGPLIDARRTVLNPNGTVDTGYTGTIHFTSSDPQAVLPANVTFSPANAGVATVSVTLKTAGTPAQPRPSPQSLTAQDTSNPGIIGSETGTGTAE